MKKSYKIASVFLAIAMLFSVFGISASAYDATMNQSSLTNVTISGNTVSGSYSVYGWLKNIEVRTGSLSGNVVGTYTSPSYSNGGTFSIKLSDNGASTAGYVVVMSSTTLDNAVHLTIPYSGPLYQMEIQRNGAKVSSVDLGINQGVASGFSFVYESGRTCAFTVDKTNIITVTRTGDAFTITPKAAGTATITATCDGTNAQTLTVNVTDDSSLSAIWYATQESITNSSKFTASSGKAYGFGVEAFPDDVTVTLTANTANATITESSVEGQFPYAIKGTTAGGSATVKIQGQTKSITFTVTFTDSAFDFFMDSNFDEVAEPLVTVAKNAKVTVYANKSVASWNVQGSGATYTTTGTSITLTGNTVDTITTVTAKDASGATLGWFDVYVLGDVVDPPDPDLGFAAFKIGTLDVYHSYYGVMQASAQTIIRDGRAYVAMREGAAVCEASCEYTEVGGVGKIMLTYPEYKAEFTVGGTDVSLYFLSGELYQTVQIPADQVPVIVDGRTYLPARVLGQISCVTGRTYIYYVSNDQTGGIGEYVIYTTGEATEAQLKTMAQQANTAIKG